MPKTTPSIKVEAVRSFGGEVVLHGDTYDEAADHAKALAKSKNFVEIHPFDDPDTIAGQASVESSSPSASSSKNSRLARQTSSAFTATSRSARV